MAKRLWSILTDDMDSCYYTGSTTVERHHVYYRCGGGLKPICEKYGYVVPLRPDLHPNGVQADIRYAKQIDLELKQLCQRDFEKKHGTREDFRRIFGKSYL